MLENERSVVNQLMIFTILALSTLHHYADLHGLIHAIQATPAWIPMHREQSKGLIYLLGVLIKLILHLSIATQSKSFIWHWSLIDTS